MADKIPTELEKKVKDLAGGPVPPPPAARAAAAVPAQAASAAPAARNLGGLGKVDAETQKVQQTISQAREIIGKFCYNTDAMVGALAGTLDKLRALPGAAAEADRQQFDLTKAGAFLADVRSLLDKHFPTA